MTIEISGFLIILISGSHCIGLKREFLGSMSQCDRYCEKCLGERLGRGISGKPRTSRQFNRRLGFFGVPSLGKMSAATLRSLWSFFSTPSWFVWASTFLCIWLAAKVFFTYWSEKNFQRSRNHIIQTGAIFPVVDYEHLPSFSPIFTFWARHLLKDFNIWGLCFGGSRWKMWHIHSGLREARRHNNWMDVTERFWSGSCLCCLASVKAYAIWVGSSIPKIDLLKLSRKTCKWCTIFNSLSSQNETSWPLKLISFVSCLSLCLISSADTTGKYINFWD